MYEKNVQQTVLEHIPSSQGGYDSVQVSGTAYEAIVPDDRNIELPVEEIQGVEEVQEDEGNENEDDTEETTDVSTGDVSTGDVSGGDISTGDITAGDAMPLVGYCSYEAKPLLWESDVADYDTTDGLLLLILIFTMLNTAWNIFFRR